MSKQPYTEVTELLYACCYDKPKVEVGFPKNFESSKVNITAFERNLKVLLRAYDIKHKSRTGTL